MHKRPYFHPEYETERMSTPAKGGPKRHVLGVQIRPQQDGANLALIEHRCHPRARNW